MLSDMWMRFRSLFRRKPVGAELDEELRAHAERQTAKYVQSGMPAEEARRKAKLEFGGVEQLKEESRDARGVTFIENTIRDVGYGLRQLRRNPGFTAVAILTLALGIGANTALFSVVNGVLLNPLPFTQPGRLVAIYSRTPQFPRSSISYPDFLDWRKDNRSFSLLAAFRENADLSLTGMGEPEPVKAEMVSATFFPLLGVKPAIGHLFSAADDRLDAPPVILISEGFWKQKFNGSPDAVGKTLTLSGTLYTIVGVIPASFQFSSGNFHQSDVYLPIGQWSEPLFRDRRTGMGMDAVGRLEAGVTLVQAKADMDAVAQHLAEEFPDADQDKGVTMLPLQQNIVGDVRPFLLMLLAAVGFVLLIACVNVANLLLARSTGRTREFAIRVALGAGPAHVIRQLLTESILLAVAGGGLGLLLAAWVMQPALRLLPRALPLIAQVRVDARVLIFTLAVSVFAGLLFGLAPAFKAFQVDVHETLKEGGRGSSGRHHRTQRVLVVVETAMAVVLLIGAGLMIRSLAKLWQVNPGFDPHNVLTFGLLTPALRGAKPDSIRAALKQIDEKLESIPGVDVASLLAGSLPMEGDSELPFWRDGQPKPSTQSQMKVALFYFVQPDYLKVMRIPLERGRFLGPQDNEHSAPVVVIDSRFAQLYFGGENPIGQRIHLGIVGGSPEIVGVVGHVKQWGLDADARSPVQAQMYLPISQIADNLTPLLGNNIQVVVRTRGSASVTAAIREGLGQIDGQMAMFGVQPVDEIISDSLAARRFSMMLLGAFAGLALILASVGIYGVISYLVGQREHEIGIRMALGAERGDVLGMVLGQGAKMVLAGVGIGLLGAVGLTRLMARMIYGVSAHDPLTLLTVAGVLALVALGACALPAMRASRVDPAVSLRHE